MKSIMIALSFAIEVGGPCCPELSAPLSRGWSYGLDWQATASTTLAMPHATLMLRQGVHPKIVQERLGHAKVGTTLDIYSHVMPGLQQAAALCFEESVAAFADSEPSAEAVLG